MSGYICIILHAHLPFVRHPEWPDFLEEDWLYEAITETYVPLLEVFERLVHDGVPFRVTLSVSPTLAAMLADPLLQDRYLGRLDRLTELATKEVYRTRSQQALHRLARMYRRLFERTREVFVERYRRNLLTGFRRFADSGQVELITCAATHGFLPLMLPNWNAVRAQIEQGAREHARHFGRRPQGIWLPECGYAPGIDQRLRDAGLRVTFLDAHGVLYATPRPRLGVHAPIICPASGVAVFGRDAEAAGQVWSSWLGYPGDFNYREFYRDIGWDLDLDYLRPYLHGDGLRANLGIKYHRVTGTPDLGQKELYVADVARRRAVEHARHFIASREQQVERLHGRLGRPPIVVAPFDAELFGHWWFEGPHWLEMVFRRMHETRSPVQPITPSEYLERLPVQQVCQPEFSTWGGGGYADVWLNSSNDWIYPHLHMAAGRMVELARRFVAPEPLPRRALNQAARELLLAQSSDWAFILKTGTMPHYAADRIRTHVLQFTQLYDQLIGGPIDDQWLASVESRDTLFPTIDYRIYA